MINKLVKAAQSGDVAAWNTLYNHHQPWLHATALRICGNTPFVKDAVQDTFVQAYLKLSQLKDIEAFAGWLKTILIRICAHYKSPTQSGNWPFTEKIAEDEINRRLELYAQHTRLHYAVKNLSEPLQSVLMMRYFSSYQSYEDIAHMLCIPIGTVRSRLSQARQKIAEHWMQINNDNDDAYKEVQHWNHTYENYFGNVYTSLYWREKLINHFQKSMQVMFTSGQKCIGRDSVVKLIEEDLRYGSSFESIHVTSSSSISIIEAKNINAKDYPERCPDSTVFVLYRDSNGVSRMNLHNSARIMPQASISKSP